MPGLIRKRVLRIAQVSHADHEGGAEGSAWNLFKAYRARGHKSWLVVGNKFGDDPDVIRLPYANPARQGRWARPWMALAAPVESARHRVRGAGRLHTLLRYLAEPRAWLDRRRGLEDFHYPGAWRLLDLTPEPPDILHCHNLHGNYFDLRALPWLSRRVPVILNLRDAWLLSGHCAHSFDCERWKAGCGACPYLDTYPAVPRDATAYNWQRKQEIYAQSHLYVTAISQWLMDKVRSSMLSGVQYRVIPNAIDTDVFRPGSRLEARQALNLPEKSHIILLIAHNPFKDYATMEAALSRLQVLQDPPLIFVCLGREGKSRKVGQGIMIYRGFERDPTRLAEYYRAADVFIHAAHEEAFGKTVTEAMACGIPVVATAVGGIPEQLRHGETGFLVPPCDDQAMAAAIHGLLVSLDVGESIGQAGAAEARRRFSLDTQVKAFLDWYEEILTDWYAMGRSKGEYFWANDLSRDEQATCANRPAGD